MKKIINSIAAALLAATTAGAAQQDVQEAGILWNFVYDGDAFPSEDEPIRFTLDRHGEDPAEEATKDEAGTTVLRQTLGSGGWGWRILGPGPLLEEAPFLVLEIRARIVSGDGFLVGAELRNGETGGANLKVSTNSVEFGSGGRNNPVSQDIGNDFHVYRMVVGASGAKLYLDGNPEPIKQVPPSPVVGTWVAFGNFGPLDGAGVVEYDYVRWAWSDSEPPPPGEAPQG
jgi:hypothetical protein